MSEYQAGVCNIGPAEIKRRYQVSILATALYLLTSIALISSTESSPARLIAFIPAMAATVGYIQARRKFCLAYGLAGLFSFQRLGDVSKVIDPAALKADRVYAIKILLISVVPASVMTAVIFFI